MKLLIVAHPDDEVLWFNPSYFDKIFIIFGDRHDRPEMKNARLKVLAEHPLREKIELIGLDEPGLYKNKSRTKEFENAYHQVKLALTDIRNSLTISEIFTHNAQGEYGHYDHVLLHQVVREVFSQESIWCPAKGVKKGILSKKTIRKIPIDRNMFNNIREIYLKHNAWTWNNHYLPEGEGCFYLVSHEQGSSVSLEQLTRPVMTRGRFQTILREIKDFIQQVL